MKTLHLILLCLAWPIITEAQYLGFQFGTGKSTIYYSNDSQVRYNKGKSFSAGLSYEHLLNSKMSISSGTLVKYNGFSYYNSDYEGFIENDATFLNIPVLFKYKYGVGNFIRPFAGLGAFIDFGLVADNELSFGNGAKLVSGGMVFNMGVEIYNLIIAINYDLSLSRYSDFGEKFGCFQYTFAYRFGGAPFYFKSDIYTTSF